MQSYYSNAGNLTQSVMPFKILFILWKIFFVKLKILMSTSIFIPWSKIFPNEIFYRDHSNDDHKHIPIYPCIYLSNVHLVIYKKKPIYLIYFWCDFHVTFWIVALFWVGVLLLLLFISKYTVLSKIRKKCNLFEEN